MILKWSKQDLIKDLEHLRDGTDEFNNHRGKISNHELTEPINLIGLITSKKVPLEQIITTHNKSRSRLFTKGQIIEIFQDILNPNSPKLPKLLMKDRCQLLNLMYYTMVLLKILLF